MGRLLFELPLASAARTPNATALRHAGASVSYGELARSLSAFSDALIGLGVGKLERVAIYLPKQPETVVAMFGAARAGGVFVPVNPLLKPRAGGPHPARLQRARAGHVARARASLLPQCSPNARTCGT